MLEELDFQVNEGDNLTANNMAHENNESSPGSRYLSPPPHTPVSPRISPPSYPPANLPSPTPIPANQGASPTNSDYPLNHFASEHLPSPLPDDYNPSPLPPEPFIPDESSPADTRLYEKLHEMFRIGLPFCAEDIEGLKSRVPGHDGGEVRGNRLPFNVQHAEGSMPWAARRVSI